FPFPIHIGTDICQISRIHAILSGARGARFIRRVLAEEELARPRGHVKAVLDGDVGPVRDAAVFMAGRFAAKEAAFKAHPWRRLGFHDVVIQRAGFEGREGEVEGSGPPVARIKGAEGEQMAMVSISHDGDYATAFCMGFDPA
ncbi:4'-phosphopantetheinyl transferase superfamily, partial [Lasiosphaeris hirsuta]